MQFHHSFLGTLSEAPEFAEVPSIFGRISAATPLIIQAYHIEWPRGAQTGLGSAGDAAACRAAWTSGK